MAETQRWQALPAQLEPAEPEQFVLPHLSTGSRDPAPTLSLYKERFRTIEPMFAWEDKLRRLLLRFECIRGVHYAFKALACTMINLQHYCQI